MNQHLKAQLEKKFTPEQIAELEESMTEKEIQNMVNPKASKGSIAFIIVLVLVAGYWMFSGEDETKPLTQTELHKQNIEVGFDKRTGAHRTTEKMIIKALNDPDSYKHLQTTYREVGEGLIITTEFTAKNAFGGTLRKTVITSADTLGNVLDVIQWMND